jgi:hypothetical protein
VTDTLRAGVGCDFGRAFSRDRHLAGWRWL